MTKKDYDESADIARAIRGDFRARLRVEVIAPYKHALAVEINKCPNSWDGITPEKILGTEKALDASVECIAALLVMHLKTCRMPMELVITLLPALCSLVHKEAMVLATEMLVDELLDQAKKRG